MRHFIFSLTMAMLLPNSLLAQPSSVRGQGRAVKKKRKQVRPKPVSIKRKRPASKREAKVDLRTSKLFLPGMSEPTEVTYEVIDGIAYYNGDIDLGSVASLKKRYGTANMVRIPFGKSRTDKKPFRKAKSRMALKKDTDYLWPGGRIPYQLDRSLVKMCNTKKDKRCERIRKGVEMLNKATNLHLYPSTKPKDRVLIVPSKNKNSSSVGKIGDGKQKLRLSPSASPGTVAHEFLHAAGFYHTQSRPDRDRYVKIYFKNIKKGKTHNFNKHSTKAVSIGPYKTSSIMHYGPYSFSKDPKKPTITKKNGATFKRKRPTKASDMIPEDIAAINSAYRLDTLAKTSTILRVCLKNKAGSFLTASPSLTKFGTYSKKNRRCNNDNTLELEDLNGGSLKSGDRVLIRVGQGRFVSLTKKAKTASATAMLRRQATVFKVYQVRKKKGATIKRNAKVKLKSEYGRYLSASSRRGAAKNVRKSKKAAQYTLTIRSQTRNKDKTAKVAGKPFTGHWGDWGPWGRCPTGYRATGFQQRVQAGQGSGDDTAMNGVRLVCRKKKAHKKKIVIKSYEGWWGSWSKVKECKKGHYLTAFKVSLEAKKGWGDDTSANGIKFKCSNGKWLSVTKGKGKTGKWGHWKKGQGCKSGHIGAFRTRVEAPQGDWGDDTSMNGIAISCRK